MHICAYCANTSVQYPLFLQLLPTPVDPEEAEEMFDFADKNKDSKIGWEEFQVFQFYLSFQFHKNKDSEITFTITFISIL